MYQYVQCHKCHLFIWHKIKIVHCLSCQKNTRIVMFTKLKNKYIFVKYNNYGYITGIMTIYKYDNFLIT